MAEGGWKSQLEPWFSFSHWNSAQQGSVNGFMFLFQAPLMSLARAQLVKNRSGNRVSSEQTSSCKKRTMARPSLITSWACSCYHPTSRCVDSRLCWPLVNGASSWLVMGSWSTCLCATSRQARCSPTVMSCSILWAHSSSGEGND